MKPLTILFDADDVVEDLCGRWASYLNELYGTNVKLEDITSWDFASFFPTIPREEVFAALGSVSMWEGLEPIPGAREVLSRLREEGHSLFMVTAPDYRTPRTKFDQIFGMLPWLDWDHVICASHKQMIQGDILIDDGPHNLVGGEYAKILFDRPHNRSFDGKAHGMTRVRTWNEVEQAVHVYARLIDGLARDEERKKDMYGMFSLF